MDRRDIPADGGVVLIDWACGVCQGTRRWIERHSSPGRFVLHALDGPAGRDWLRHVGWHGEPPDSVVLVERDRWSMRSTAVLRILRRMRGAWRLGYAFILVPRPVRDWAYQRFAKVRHRVRVRG